MTGYVAKFSLGRSKSIANSKREYAAAWLFTVSKREINNPHVAGGKQMIGPTTVMGFARDREMAAKAIDREANHYLRDLRTRKPNGASIIEREVVAVERV